MNSAAELSEWKQQSGHTMREMGRRIGVSGSHVCRVIKKVKTLSKSAHQNLTEVRRLENLIEQNTSDKFMIEYELDIFIKKVTQKRENKT